MREDGEERDREKLRIKERMKRRKGGNQQRHNLGKCPQTEKY